MPPQTFRSILWVAALAVVIYGLRAQLSDRLDVVWESVLRGDGHTVSELKAQLDATTHALTQWVGDYSAVVQHHFATAVHSSATAWAVVRKVQSLFDSAKKLSAFFVSRKTATVAQLDATTHALTQWVGDYSAVVQHHFAAAVHLFATAWAVVRKVQSLLDYAEKLSTFFVSQKTATVAFWAIKAFLFAVIWKFVVFICTWAARIRGWIIGISVWVVALIGFLAWALEHLMPMLT